MAARHRTPPPSKLPAWVAQELRADIAARHQPRDRLPTVAELARRFQVSKHSVSNALEILARDGIVEMRRGWGVHVAAAQRPRRIGILSDLDLLHPRTGHYFRGLASALLERLRGLGAAPALYTGQYRSPLAPPAEPVCPQFWEDLDAGRLDGGVIVDAWLNDAYFARCRRSPVPLVGTHTGLGVETDTAGIVSTAVRRLAEQGCKRLGLMTWEFGNAVEPFKRTVAECGMTTTDAWLKGDTNPNLAGAGWDEFREIWAASREKPDGLVILDDMLFSDAQMAIFELGVDVPRQLRLAAQFNRGSEVPLRVPVTAIEIDPAEAAKALADMLLQRLRGDAPAPITHTLAFREIAVPEPPTATDRPRPQPPGIARHRQASRGIEGYRCPSTPVESRRVPSTAIGSHREQPGEDTSP